MHSQTTDLLKFKANFVPLHVEVPIDFTPVHPFTEALYIHTCMLPGLSILS